MKKTKTTEWMKHSARAYNRHLTMEYLDTLTPLELLHIVHKTDRSSFAAALYREGLISAEDAYKYTRQ